MTAVEQLVATLSRLDIKLWEEHGSLRFSAPRGALTGELRAQLVSHKPELLALLRAADAATRPALPPIRPREPGRPIPLTYAQERLWFLDQLHPGNPAYNLAQVLRIKGRLDNKAMRRAFEAIVQRHETLRTTFVAEGDLPCQVVHDVGTAELVLEDLSGHDPGTQGTSSRSQIARTLLQREISRPFDLSRGPLIRARLLRLSEHEHLLAVVMHHIVGDAWSEAVFLEELRAFYTSFSADPAAAAGARAAGLADLEIQVGDYAVWQRQCADLEVVAAQREHWRRALAGAPRMLELVTDRPRPSTQTFAGDRIQLQIPRSLGNRIARIAADESTTPFVILLAAWALVLARHSRQQDIVIGSPVANRDRSLLEPLIGFLVNTLALRVDLSADLTVMELLHQVRQTVLSALEHQEVPFERVVDDLSLPRDLSQTPVFQTMLVMINPSDAPPPPGLGWSREEVAHPFAKLDLTLFVSSTTDTGLSCELEYNSDLFEAATATLLASHLVQALELITTEPGQQLSTLSLLSPTERQMLIGEAARAQGPAPPAGCAHHLIEQQARRSPRAVAVTCGQASLSYAQLDQAADQAARALRARGVGPGVPVGLCLPRRPDLLIGLLAVWKAGGAFLPLDPDNPDERLAYMVQDSAAPLVLVDEVTGCRQSLGKIATVESLIAAGGKTQPEANDIPRVSATAGDLAYVIYTSGSTGRPKGVMIPHGALVSYLVWCCEAYPVNQGTGAPVYTSIGFDATLTSLLAPLVAGSTVDLLGSDEPIEELAERLRAPTGYSFVKVTPAHLDVLAAMLSDVSGDIDQGCTSCFIIGGEALLGRHLAGWRQRLPSATFINEYGPTETVVGCAVHQITPADEIAQGRVPIGRPIANTRLLILDDNQMPAPFGVPGELNIAGAGVGLGYLNQPELTAATHRSIAAAEAGGARLYRTGDLARRLADGSFDYLGRIDDQLNINGLRIEPGEIEAVIGEHPGIAECVVAARELARGDRSRLVAYFTALEGQTITRQGLLEHLREQLPEHMLPTSLVALEQMPLTANGKIDRAALPEPEPSEARGGCTPPATEIEKTLAEIWQGVLGLDRIGINDSFFELGGDSIMSIQVVARAAREGLALTPRLIFQHQTIAELARHAERARARDSQQDATSSPEAAAGPVPLTPIQSWFFSQGLVEPHHYNQAVLLETAADTSPSRLGAAFAEVLRHHQAFRLRFSEPGGRWQQRLIEQPAEPPAGDGSGAPFEVIDLSHLESSERGIVITTEAERLQRSLSLEQGPLIRGLYLSCGEATGRLALVAHHLVVDGVSWRILLDDLAHCYSSLSADRRPDLPRAGSSVAAWSRRLVAEISPDQGSRQPELEGWQEIVSSASGRLPIDLDSDPTANTVATVEVETIELDEQTTARLVSRAASHYGVALNELLIAALARALASWCQGPDLLIEVESHGRELPFVGSDEQAAATDLSRTVGWFTSIYPLRLTLDQHTEPASQTHAAARQLRALPGRAGSYSALRYLHPQGHRLAAPDEHRPQLIWNYLGHLGISADQSPLLGPASENVGPLASPLQQRSHLLDVQAAVVADRLRVDWGFSTACHRRATIRRLAERFLAALQWLATFRDEPGASQSALLESIDETEMDQLSEALLRLDERVTERTLQSAVDPGREAQP